VLSDLIADITYTSLTSSRREVCSRTPIRNISKSAIQQTSCRRVYNDGTVLPRETHRSAVALQTAIIIDHFLCTPRYLIITSRTRYRLITSGCANQRRILDVKPSERRRGGLAYRYNALVSINEVDLRRTRLLLGWVTVCGHHRRLGGVVVRASDLCSKDREFNSRPGNLGQLSLPSLWDR